MPLLLVRHAWAGDRNKWEGDDRLRPLDERGRGQSLALVEQLARFPIDAILTSPYLRCAETVAPLAAARGLQAELRQELGEERQYSDGFELVRSLAARDVVVCGHGGLETVLDDPPKWRKGSTLVLSDRFEIVEVLRS